MDEQSSTRVCARCFQLHKNIAVYCHCGGLIVYPSLPVKPEEHYLAIAKALQIHISSNLNLESMH